MERYKQSLTAKLAAAQERTKNAKDDSPAFNAAKTLYRLYTQWLSNVDIASYIGRYFDGATVYRGIGLDARTQDASENAVIIEIVSSASDALQRVLHLAGDLRVAGNQISVLVTVQDVRTFEVTDVATETKPTVERRALDCPSDSPTYNRASKAQAHRFSEV
jgi:hypothetical protein